MRRDRAELILASALMLFVELVLIRWTGAMVVYLSYFSNFVLLGSFLGIGIGFLRARKAPDSFPWRHRCLPSSPPSSPPCRSRSIDLEAISCSSAALQEHGLPAWFMLPLIFIAVAAIMATLAHGVAQFDSRSLRRSRPTGSRSPARFSALSSFAAVAFLGTLAARWGGLIAAALLILGLKRSLVQLASVALIVAIFAMGSFYPRSIWSPYYLIRWH